MDEIRAHSFAPEGGDRARRLCAAAIEHGGPQALHAHSSGEACSPGCLRLDAEGERPLLEPEPEPERILPLELLVADLPYLDPMGFAPDPPSRHRELASYN